MLGQNILGPSGHTDTFTRDRLPPADQQPEFKLAGFDYPGGVKAEVELTDVVDELDLGTMITERCKVAMLRLH